MNSVSKETLLAKVALLEMALAHMLTTHEETTFTNSDYLGVHCQCMEIQEMLNDGGV